MLTPLIENTNITIYNMQSRCVTLVCSGLTILLCLAPATFSKTGWPTQAGDYELSLRHAKQKRYFVLHLPPTFSPTQKTPVVIVLHGGAGNARNAMHMTGMSQKSDAEGFIAVYPQGSGRLRKRVLTWNAANCCGYARKYKIDDVGFIAALLDTMQMHYPVDPKRIFVTGMSNGGMMAFKLACQLAGRIAAVAPVAAACNDTTCVPTSPVSVVMFNGTLDKRVPYAGGSGEEATEKRWDKSVSESISFWVRHNGCDVKSKIKNEGGFTRELFGNGKAGTEVLLYTVNGGGHAWPGGKRGYLFGDIPSSAISATDAMWEFFKTHPKR